MKRFMLAALMLIAPAAFLAARSQHEQAEPQRHTGQMPMMMMQDCPMNVHGTELTVADTNDGIALTFTTKTSDLAELRRRLEHMANMHNAHVSQGAMMRGQFMASAVKYETIQDGGRLILTPKDPAQLDAFRKQVREHVEQMKKGDCSMMMGMMGAMTRPEPKPQEDDHEKHHPK